ncbi:aldehyde dehydrogenase family protein [Alkalilacustris brevis]|uniref:aldehyde dehydrogenase family protein n=1 Tax=Alkalilacustris brevis TaxID=2026338 RepID=UPI000E0DC150|nr:aldehyde dehydrogenase family protein [Alkalilacustris brevis]
MELGERLLVYYIAGAWRAPLGTAMRPVPLARGGQRALVEAGPEDVARALAAVQSGGRVQVGPGAGGEAVAAALEAQADLLTEAIMLEHGVTRAEAARELAASLRAASVPPDLPVLPKEGALLLLGAVGARPALWAGALAGGLAVGRSLLIKPAPRAPVVPLMLVAALHGARLLRPGALGLVQGGGATTGRALLVQPGLAGALLLGRGAARPGLAGAAEDAGLPLICVPGPDGL